MAGGEDGDGEEEDGAGWGGCSPRPPPLFFSEVVGGAVQDSDKDVSTWQ